jgi:hypothetical protein
MTRHDGVHSVSWLRFTWRAGADGVAHAVSPRVRSFSRTSCGIPVVEERAAWPERTRCGECLQALGFLPIGDVPAAVR